MIKFSVWDTYRSRYKINSGILKIEKESEVLFEKSFSFQPFWQETIVTLNSTEIEENLKIRSGSHFLKIIVENAAGQHSSLNFVIEIERNSPSHLIALITGIFAFGVVIILIKIKFDIQKID